MALTSTQKFPDLESIRLKLTTSFLDLLEGYKESD